HLLGQGLHPLRRRDRRHHRLLPVRRDGSLVLLHLALRSALRDRGSPLHGPETRSGRGLILVCEGVGASLARAGAKRYASIPRPHIRPSAAPPAEALTPAGVEW